MRTIVLLVLLFGVTVGVARAAPGVVVLLGCQDKAELAARVEAAGHLLERASNRRFPLVVLSGGTRRGGPTEAHAMRQALTPCLHARPVADLLVLEERSLDTIGNALFTARLLKARGARVRELTVVTSDFHAPRARALFERAFGPGVAIRVVGAAPPGRSAARTQRRLAHEAASAAQSMREIFDGIAPGDLDGLERRLFERHALYRAPSRLGPYFNNSETVTKR